MEDQDWRGLFSEAFGETLEIGQTLAILADQDLAAFVRDNSAFLIGPKQISLLGVVDYPNCRRPDEVLTQLRLLP